MSSSTLTDIQTKLSLYGYPFFMILGSIGNVFVIVFFSRQRENACSIYLLSSAVVNILYLTIIGFVQIFPLNHADGTLRAVVLCKIFTYIPSTLGQISTAMLILACIDRFMITHHRASFRAFSTPKKAKYLIFFTIIFYFLFGIHLPILTTIINGQCTRVGIYTTVYTIYSILFVGLIPSFTLGILGYLTYRNIRQMHNRVQPIVRGGNNGNVPIRHRDRDLLILVITEVFVYVITIALFPLINLETMISRYVISNKSLQYIQAEVLTVNIALLLLFINNALPFYTYLIASKSFRRDLKQLCINSYRKLRRQQQQPVQNVGRTDRTLPQQETRV